MSICPRCDGEGFGDNYTGNCPRCGGGGNLADVTNPTLIPWDQVAKGPVWFRPKGSGGDHWYAGLRFGQTLLDGTGPVCAIEMEFTPAEQQPGEHVREVVNDVVAEGQLLRLRDGLAALEQEMREHCASGQPAFDSQIREWVDDLAALREGQGNG